MEIISLIDLPVTVLLFADCRCLEGLVEFVFLSTDYFITIRSNEYDSMYVSEESVIPVTRIQLGVPSLFFGICRTIRSKWRIVNLLLCMKELRGCRSALFSWIFWPWRNPYMERQYWCRIIWPSRTSFSSLWTFLGIWKLVIFSIAYCETL